jgi:hypothetical protein
MRGGYLSDLEKSFALRAVDEGLAEGWDGLPPHLMEWMKRKRT